MAARAAAGRRAGQADREHAGADAGDAEPGGERNVLADQPAAQQRDDQRRRAAHHRIGEAELAVAVGADQRHVVADVDHHRRREPRPVPRPSAARRWRPATAPTTQPRTWISAVSSALSLPELMSAFHEAWSRAPNRTAPTTVQLSVSRHGSGRVAQAAARARKWASDGVARSACLARSSHWRSITASRAAGRAMKALGLRGVEHAALQREAALRVVRQPLVVVVVGLAEIALGVDVQLDRVEHRVGEQAAQERQGEVLVGVVDAAQGRRLALVVEQVAEVVQQAGGDELVARRRSARRSAPSAARARAASPARRCTARRRGGRTAARCREAQHGACWARGWRGCLPRRRRAPRTATGGSASR